jgi:hypothetical protein
MRLLRNFIRIHHTPRRACSSAHRIAIAVIEPLLVEQLEDRTMPATTFLATFDGVNGSTPTSGVVVDGSGDLFGTTGEGGATGQGTVYELVKEGSGYSLVTLANFDNDHGSEPTGGVVIDALGNLYGTAREGGVLPSGGTHSNGTVYELVNTGLGYVLTTLADFNLGDGANGANPVGGVVRDATGNLFGVTENGGPANQGTVYKLVNTGAGYVLTTLATFDRANGAEPMSGLTMDSDGNLYGTTYLGGGANGIGTAYELVNTGVGYSFETLFSFDDNVGARPIGGLTLDAAGDLFGTTTQSGEFGNGFGGVFELVNSPGGYTIRDLAFFGLGAGDPHSGVVLDAAGDVFGTTPISGIGGYGQVYELVRSGSAYTFTTLASFTETMGDYPNAGVTLDANGNLFGTTSGDQNSFYGVGTVYEVDRTQMTGTGTPAAAPVGEFAAGADAGGSPVVNIYNSDGSVKSTITAFDPGFTGGVRTALADFNGDGVPDLAVGVGPGVTAEVKILDGKTGATLFDVKPFADFTGGVFVAAGDVTGDGIADLIITPDLSGGPRVEVYQGGDFQEIANFFGIDDPNFRGGARAAAGDLNGDGKADLVISAGFGGGPRISIYDAASLLAGNFVHLIGDFFAFDDSLRNGAFVAVSDVNGDGINDLIFGAGPGGGPRVLVISGATVFSNGATTAIASPIANYFSGDPNSRGGVRVAAKNLDGDQFADIITGAGQNGGSIVTATLGKTLIAGNDASDLSFSAFPGFSGGVFVG